MDAAVVSMERIYAQLAAVRQQQGFSATDVHLSVARTSGAAAPGDGADHGMGSLSRHELDVRLAVAEMEAIAGLPDYPAALPLGERDARQLHSFQLRRCAGAADGNDMCGALLWMLLEMFRLAP